MKILMILLLFLSTTTVQAEEPEHGAVDKRTLQVWDVHKGEWSSIESFWQGFAQSNNAKFWGRTQRYPNYDDVNEFDTVLIQLRQGTCLMQFFHSRWRRANDVQRWDGAFNLYGGCSFVFD